MDASDIRTLARTFLNVGRLLLAPAVTADIKELQGNLRASDVRELSAWKLDASALYESHSQSVEDFAVRNQAGELLCVFGVGPIGHTVGKVPFRLVWLVGTPALDTFMHAAPRQAFLLGRYTLARFTRRFGKVGNWIAKGLTALRAPFLKTCGCTVVHLKSGLCFFWR